MQIDEGYIDSSAYQALDLGARHVRGHAYQGGSVAGGDRHEADQGGVRGEVQEQCNRRRRRRHLLQLQGHAAGTGRH
jgi:hypothetical protein